jgi:glycosyltransferase involved in cell wall biosynthesis
MKRVLYIHNSADRYGASRSLLRLVRVLPREDWQPVIVVPEDGPLLPELAAAGVETHILRGLGVITRPAVATWGGRIRFGARALLSAAVLARFIRHQRIDLVHTNTGVIVSAGVAARLARRPHVWHVRDWFQEFGGVWPAYARYMRWSADEIIAVSSAVASQFPSTAGVIVVHNGFSLDEFVLPAANAAREFRERHGFGDAFLVGCVGRIKAVRKGQEVLVEALAVLATDGRRPRCVIIGAPSPGNESHLIALRQLVEARGLSAQVALIGEIPDARWAYPALDALVLPSAQPEPFGGVVMEAMAMGVPVIATAVGGSVEQVAEGETGLLVPPGDAPALAAAIARLMDEPALRRAMAEAGPARIREHFDLGQMVGQFLAVYERVLGGH